MVNYPKDWYRHLVVGDVVKCVEKKNPTVHIRRIIGKLYTIVNNSNGIEVINYAEGLTAHSDLTDFEPVRMKAFPELNKVTKYSIF